METLPRLKSRDQTRLAHWLPLQLKGDVKLLSKLVTHFYDDATGK